MRSEDKLFDELSSKLYILGEPIRMQIMRVICNNGSLRAVDILEEFSISQPTLSHHMNLLLEAGLVTTRKDGRSIWYSINNDTIGDLISFIGDLKAGPRSSSGAGKTSVPPRKTVKRTAAAGKTKAVEKPALKNDSAVPKPKNKIEAPDIEELKKKKEKKKKKDDKKKKDKDKKKKK